MSEGTSVLANDYDNHELHVLTHNKYRKTQQFEYLQDAQKALFQQHVELHKAAIAAKQPPMPMPG
jgi:hypothetical protein